MIDLPDLRRVDVIALDTETRDGGLAENHGSSWPWGDGYVCGVSVAWNGGSLYAPLRHPESACLDRGAVSAWLHDLVASDVRIITMNGLYDWGWLETDIGIRPPPSDRMEEVGAMAVMVDENRLTYNLDDLCRWRGVPGKDETALLAAIERLPKTKKRLRPKSRIWELPTDVVASYARADAEATLALWRSLSPVLDEEGTREAYRLEVDLLSMVGAMRRRGIRVDLNAAERARDELLRRRDEVFDNISARLGERVGMEEIGKNKWLVQTFAQHAPEIVIPRTEPRTRFPQGQASFTAGTTGWMHKHPHWLPRAIVRADKLHNAATKFIQNYILEHAHNGRVYAEVHPHRSDDGGAVSFRFSYSHPPLQQAAARDPEIAPLVRGAFLPEEGQIWAKPDVSSQEFRLIVHYAAKEKLTRSDEAVARYRTDPDTDFHQMVADMTGLDRGMAKNTNFAKAFGAGVPKFAVMLSTPEREISIDEAKRIYAQYDHEMPFVSELYYHEARKAQVLGYTVLYDKARRHWNAWEPRKYGRWGSCDLNEARRRVADPTHPWHRHLLRRAQTHKAMNALIQGSAARHTKLAMREIYREGIVPLLQMHDAIDCSVSSEAEGRRVAEIMCNAVSLLVPMRVDLKFGRNWGDAKHEWSELQ